MSNAPPPPPPHGAKHAQMPDGPYDIFILPPNTTGNMIYLPSLQCHRNSFLAGVAFALAAVGFWSILFPAITGWFRSLASSGGGILLFVAAVGVCCWAWGKTQGESAAGSGPGTSGGAAGPGTTGPGSSSQHGGHTSGGQNYGFGGFGRFGSGFGGGSSSRPTASSTRPPPPGAASGWEKAREETRKREEERKKAEDIKKKQEEAQKAKEDKERAARAAAEKDKWEQARAREKDAREREARERIAKEKLARERNQNKKYERPTAQSCTEDGEEYSYRPYDTPKGRHKPQNSSGSSVSGVSESSFAPSQSTARTTPPPSHRGPYSTKDPDKIVIKGVYMFNNMFPKPVSQLVSGEASVTDGLILRITTEGLFIDDDVRGVPQREWDVKAWGMKLVEVRTIHLLSSLGVVLTTACRLESLIAHMSSALVYET